MWIWALGALALALSVLASLKIGRFDVSFADIFAASFGQDLPPAARTVIFDLRLPRIIAAFLVGAALGVSGAALQNMFANPLVSPNVLGVAGASGFGAALGILLFGSSALTQASAFGFGLLAAALSWALGSVANKRSNLMMVLSGLIVGASFSAALAGLKYLADPMDKLPAIVYWLMGSLALIKWEDLAPLAALSGFGMLGLLAIRWKINILALGRQGFYLGERVRLLGALVIVLSTLATSSAVAFCGIIGWVGLLVPHIARMLFGANTKGLIPASIFIGGIYMIWVDTLARSLSSVEIPLSILTSLIGAPLVGILILKKGKEWS